MTDPLLRLLDGLPTAMSDPARADRVRARCHAALARHRPRPGGNSARTARFWTSIVAGLGGIYVTAAVQQALSLYGLL